jgi:phytoene synthase
MLPHSPEPAVTETRRDALDAVSRERLMRGGSKTFFAASLLLPDRVRTPAIALYAFCRLADDAVDLDGDPAARLADLQRRLRQIYAGQPLPLDADQALTEVVAHFDIPHDLPAALLEGFEWDAEGRQYETLEDVHAYGARVAGTVGAMMSLIMGARNGHALARACELGVAMQLTNIARDVGEDARRGRLYLPRAWMREAGIDPDAWLRAPVFDGALAAVVARLLAAADDLYHRAAHGIPELPRRCRPAIQAARVVYAEIGRAIEQAGLDSVSRRAVVPGSQKLKLVARSLGAAFVAPARVHTGLAPLPAIRFLVDAAADSPREVGPLGVPGRRTLRQKALWMIDLFERLAERDRVAGLMQAQVAADGSSDGS